MTLRLWLETGLVGGLCPGTPSRTLWQTSSACLCVRPASFRTGLYANCCVLCVEQVPSSEVSHCFALLFLLVVVWQHTEPRTLYHRKLKTLDPKNPSLAPRKDAEGTLSRQPCYDFMPGWKAGGCRSGADEQARCPPARAKPCRWNADARATCTVSAADRQSAQSPLLN